MTEALVVRREVQINAPPATVGGDGGDGRVPDRRALSSQCRRPTCRARGRHRGHPRPPPSLQFRLGGKPASSTRFKSDEDRPHRGGGRIFALKPQRPAGQGAMREAC